jgi:long-subunit fatty acid transport protein
MKKFYIIILIFVCLLFAEDNKSSSTALFLRITPGSRPAGMGNAFVGLSDDVNSIYFNPAGTTLVKYPQMFVSYLQWFEDINSSYLGFVYPLGKQSIGVALNYLSFGGGFELRNENGVLIEDTQQDMYNSAIVLTFARNVQKNISVGIGVKSVLQKYLQYNANGFTVDISGLFVTKKFSLGLNVQNLGPQIVVSEVSNNLPLSIKFGGGYKPTKNISVGLDIDKPQDNNVKFYTGAEYIYQDKYAIRLGYNQIDNFDLQKGWCFGLGAKTEIGKETSWEKTSTASVDVSLDYAVTYFGEELGYIHRISLTIGFIK